MTPCRSTGRNSGPWVIPERVRHCSIAANRAVPRSAEWDADLSARPLLVGLAPTQVNDDPLTHRHDVLNIQASQLGSSKSSSKPDQEERPVASVLEAVAYRIKDCE